MRLYEDICVYIVGGSGSVFFDCYSANCVRYINIYINSFPRRGQGYCFPYRAQLIYIGVASKESRMGLSRKVEGFRVQLK